MNTEESVRVFKSYQEFVEVADKFRALMFPIPKSFLPYPYDEIVAGLNMMIEMHLSAGDTEKAKAIKESMAFVLSECKDDEDALNEIQSLVGMMSKNPDLKEQLLKNLKESAKSWLVTRR